MNTPRTPEPPRPLSPPRPVSTGSDLADGWAYSSHDSRLHYFRHGRSLCGRQSLWPADRQLTAEPLNTLDTCPPCRDAHDTGETTVTGDLGSTGDGGRPPSRPPRSAESQCGPDPPPPLAQPDPLAP